MTISCLSIAKNLVGFVICVIWFQEVQNELNVQLFALLESTHVQVFVRLVKLDALTFLNLLQPLLQKQLLLLMKTLLNLLSNLVNIFLNSIARKVADCASFAVFLAWIKLGQNAKNIVEMVLRLVPILALLVRPNVLNSFLPFLTYQLQLMRKFNSTIREESSID